MKENPRGYELPEVISPPTISFCIEVPDDPVHLRAFWGAMWSLTRPYNWGNDEEHTALAVADVWRELWLKNHTAWRERECSPEITCQAFSPSAPMLTWGPENPYAPGEDVPPGYIFHPWTIVDGSLISTIISEWGLGYQIGDIYTDITKLPEGDWGEIIEDGYLIFPHFRVNDLNGSGTVKLHLLNIPQGGRALIVVDGVLDLLNLRLVELNKDIVSIPLETQVPIIIEVEIPLEGEHYIDVVYVPNVNDEVIPFFFGGGIRKIEICGFGREGCGDCMSEECCDELNANQQTTNELLAEIISMMRGGMTADIRFKGGTTPPDEAGGNCAPDYFDHDSDDEEEGADLRRYKALCLTVNQYVKAILIKVLRDMNAPQALIDFVDGKFPDVTVPLTLSNLTVVYPNALFSLSIFFNALAGDIDIETVACEMLSGLTGDKNNTSSNFRDCLLGVDLGEELQDFVRLVHGSNAVTQNYKDFNTTLNANNDLDLDEYVCPCGPMPSPECDDAEIDLVVNISDLPSVGTIITPLGGNLFQIQQSTRPTGLTPYIASFKDANGKCLFVEIVEGTQTGIFAHATWGCSGVGGDCDSEDTTDNMGDFNNSRVLIIAWQHPDPINTVYRVTCCVPTP